MRSTPGSPRWSPATRGSAIIFPLASQQSAASESDYGTMLKSSLATIGGSQSSDLARAIDRVPAPT
jgi:hypothetical protein